MSPGRKYDVDEAASRGIDRYVPGNRSGNRSRSPMPDDVAVAAVVAGRELAGKGEAETEAETEAEMGAEIKRAEEVAAQTQEELDAEMADYFGGGNSGETAPQPNGGATAAAAVPATADDIDMIE
ncbi:RNA binding protein [Colletotrichum tofieldiae]|nr:RNA binding protein [Colletotrichum tofieldiae]